MMHAVAQVVLWTIGTCAILNVVVFSWIAYRRRLMDDIVSWLLLIGLGAFSYSCIVTALDAWTRTSAWTIGGTFVVSIALLLVRRAIASSRRMKTSARTTSPST